MGLMFLFHKQHAATQPHSCGNAIGARYYTVLHPATGWCMQRCLINPQYTKILKISVGVASIRPALFMDLMISGHILSVLLHAVLF